MTSEPAKIFTWDGKPVAQPALWRKTRAWTLALSFGLVNGGYAICVAWLPDFYHQLGWSAQAGGSLLGMMIGCQVAGALRLVTSLLLAPVGTHTVAVSIWRQFEQGSAGQGMAMATLTMLTGLTLMLSALALMQRSAR